MSSNFSLFAAQDDYGFLNPNEGGPVTKLQGEDVQFRCETFGVGKGTQNSTTRTPHTRTHIVSWNLVETFV